MDINAKLSEIIELVMSIPDERSAADVARRRIKMTKLITDIDSTRSFTNGTKATPRLNEIRDRILKIRKENDLDE